jgi:hypothetical protein
MGRSIRSHYEPVKTNTKEETAAELAAKPHRWRIYTDGGCDDSGKGTTCKGTTCTPRRYGDP